LIHVIREAAPAILTDPDGPGFRERDRAIAFYAVAANSQLPFDYQIYKSDAVRRALLSLFRGKCAYCESRFAAMHPVDVEHFRPKGGVAIYGKRVKPGYYWLATTWTNLLPSCIDCNRARKQDIEGGDPKLGGKENQFPLADESKRAKKPGDEVAETHLLLDPCHDDPASHLEFRDDGFVVEKTSARGKASIEVYALWRSELVFDRLARVHLIRRDIVRTQRAIRILDRFPEDPDTREQVRDLLDGLIGYMSSDQPFSALARTLIQPFLDEVEAMGGTA
jgi:uncharacterized protein (TIGR02646 family)